ncbi:MAG TPA: hypothetical protein V6D02_06085, partial [Candidatus Obscuribacterales bacterium]
MQQSNSLDFKLVQRVCLLQQALDQALGSLHELKAQLRDKQWIEAQLANTEEYANAQQQAIAHLKQQLAQFTEVQNHLLSVMGYRLNELIEHQQQDFNHLHIHFQQSHTELQTYLQYLGRQHQGPPPDQDSEAYRLALEAEVVIARSMAVHLSKHLTQAKQHLGNLKADLSNHHLNLSHIIKTIQAMIADLASFDGAEAVIQPQLAPAAAPEGSWLLSADDVMDSLEGDAQGGTWQTAVRRQSLRIHELETVLMENIEHETQLRQRYQEVAAER